MKVTFIGSSHGIPSAERYCSCTMIEVNGALYFIDAGAPVIDLLLRRGRHPNEIRAVFCTHHHGDHTDGLLNLTDLCNWAYTDSSVDIFVTKAEQAEILKACVIISSKPVDTDRLRYHTAKAGTVYEDENVRVTYFPTRHCEPFPSYAILVEAEGKRALFTGDMSNGLEKNDFPVYAIENETDLVVSELAHFACSAVVPYAERLRTKRLVFNHVNFAHGGRKFEEIEEMNVSGKYPFTVAAANDGDEILL